MKHLTAAQRYTISVMQQKFTQKEIAEMIGVSKSTISRELKRNCDKRNGTYNSDLAHRKAQGRKKGKEHAIRLTLRVQKRIRKLLKRGYSPEQIAGREHLEGRYMVSHETIYKWIWQDKRQGGDLHKFLRRQGRRYVKRSSKNAGRGHIPNRIDIDQRPKEVEDKLRFGDLEIDTIIGKNHKGAILTINDRASGRVWIRKLTGKDAALLAMKTKQALRKVKHLIVDSR